MSKPMEMNEIVRKIMSKEKETEFYEEMKLFAEEKIRENKTYINTLECYRQMKRDE